MRFSCWQTLDRITVPWVLALLVPLCALWLRPAVPLDETRYLAVAWEMWLRGDFLLPQLNGEAYPDKPPLLFWLMHLGWWLGGVGDMWPRLIPAIFLALSLVWMERFAGVLGLERRTGRCTSFLMLACLIPVLFAQQLMFDYLLLFFLLAALERAAVAAESGRTLPLLMAGVLLGLGGLAKGPIILVYFLPVALLLLPLLENKESRLVSAASSMRVLAMVVTGLAVAGTWLGALAMQDQLGFLQSAVLDQAADRVAGEIGHGRPVWWYLPVVALFIIPGLLSRSVIRGIRPAWDAVLPRRLLIATGIIFLLLSLIGGKQPHYLLPWLPFPLLALATQLDNARGSWRPWASAAFVLIASTGLLIGQKLEADFLDGMNSGWLLVAIVFAVVMTLQPARDIDRALCRQAIVVVVFAGLLLLALREPILQRYDVRDSAEAARIMEEQGKQLAWTDVYHGELHFYGRLRKPVTEVTAMQLPEWLEERPDAVLFARREFLHLLDGCMTEWSRTYRSSTLSLLSDCR